MSELIKIIDIDLSGKCVLIREDYNVPIKDGEIEDAIRRQRHLSAYSRVKGAISTGAVTDESDSTEWDCQCNQTYL